MADTIEFKGRRNECPTKRRLFGNVISADEAKKRSESSKKVLIEAELAEVYETVYEESGKGLYEAKVHKILEAEALNRLVELGYTYEPIGVNNMDEGFRQTGYKITWK
jgi:hypothetical protein